MSNTSHAIDWREQLRENSAKTRWVIAIFVLLYISVGLLIDLFIHISGYTQIVTTNGIYQSPMAFEQLFIALITFKVIPWATLIASGIAIISLLITFTMYDRIMLLGTEYLEITQENTDPQAQQLYNVVEEMKVAAGMHYMPRIYIINADYMNAFASGYSEKSAMVAITKGLLDKLDRSELQAVMAHELSHIRHGDIKLTLTTTVLSNLMLIMLDVLFYNALFSSRRREERGGNVLVVIIVLARYLLPIITALLMLYLSRTREYMADAGCVELQRDREPLIRALLKIENDHEVHADQYTAAYNQTAHENVRRAAYIFDPVSAGLHVKEGLSELFSTHPSMEKRLAALGYQQSQHS